MKRFLFLLAIYGSWSCTSERRLIPRHMSQLWDFLCPGANSCNFGVGRFIRSLNWQQSTKDPPIRKDLGVLLPCKKICVGSVRTAGNTKRSTIWTPYSPVCLSLSPFGSWEPWSLTLCRYSSDPSISIDSSRGDRYGNSLYFCYM